MAYNGRHKSLKSAMEEIYRDSGFDYVDWEDVVSWSFRLMGLIGAPNQYITKNTNGSNGAPKPIEISGFRGILPDDLVAKDSCRRITLDSEGTVSRFYPMVESSDVFFKNPAKSTEDYPVVTDPLYNTVYIDENGETQNVSITQDNNFPYGGGQMFTYKIEGNIIFTSFESGMVEMAYKAVPTDVDGFPMFPDDSKYLRAIVYEVIWQLDRRKYRRNPSPGNKAILNDSAQERAWAVGAAATKGKIPSIDEMESIKNSWLRSIPKINEHSSGFKTTSYPEQRWTHNRRLWQTGTR